MQWSGRIGWVEAARGCERQEGIESEWRVGGEGMESGWRVNGEWMESEWRVNGEWMESEWRVDGEWMESEWRVNGEWRAGGYTQIRAHEDSEATVGRLPVEKTR